MLGSNAATLGLLTLVPHSSQATRSKAREPMEVLYSFPARSSAPRRLFFQDALVNGMDLDATGRGISIHLICDHLGASPRIVAGRSGLRSTTGVLFLSRAGCLCSRWRASDLLDVLNKLLSGAAGRRLFLVIGQFRAGRCKRMKSIAEAAVFMRSLR